MRFEHKSDVHPLITSQGTNNCVCVCYKTVKIHIKTAEILGPPRYDSRFLVRKRLSNVDLPL